MDMLALIKLVLRRWYVVLPVVAAAMAAAAWMQFDVEREYEAQGRLVLSPPAYDPARAPSASAAAASALRDLQTAEGEEAIVEAGGSDDFTVTRGEGLEFHVAVPGDDAGAQRTAELVMEQIAQSVVDQQREAGIPADERIRWRSTVASDGAASLDDADIDADIEQDVASEGGDPLDDAGIDADIEQGSAPVTHGLLSLEDPTAGRANPFGADGATTSLLQYAVQSDAGRGDVFERVGHPAFRGFSVATERDPGIMTISTMAREPNVALAAFGAVGAALEAELQARQDRAEVPTSQRLTFEVLSAPAFAADVTAPVNRAAVAIVALGGLLAIGLVIVVENVAYRRRLRRQLLRDRRWRPEAEEASWPPPDSRSQETLDSR